MATASGKPLPAPPDVRELAPPFPGPLTHDVVEEMAFDDDAVMVRRLCAEVSGDRFGADAFFVPGWKGMSDDERLASALSLVLSLGDEICERQLLTDSTELTMTLDDVAEDGTAALRRFGVSAALPSPLEAGGDEQIVTLFSEIEVREGIALMLYARVPANEDAHERAIAYLAGRGDGEEGVP